MLISSPEFQCSNEILTITAMLSGEANVIANSHSVGFLLDFLVPNVWLRPNNQRKEADAAKALLTVPDGDHLTLLNVYNSYMQSQRFFWSSVVAKQLRYLTDKYDRNWAWNNFLSARALAQAENVRDQLQRNMERSELELVSITDEKKMYTAIRKVLCCGYFMQVAHKEGDKGNYLTVKDNQVRSVSREAL
jgi:pre-mRNA-splicing factor ATP-dependent RNA helicase DHX15/PRP43